MTATLAIVTNGPSKWYLNIIEKLAKHGSSWLQQDRALDRRFLSNLRRQVTDIGFFWSYAYVQLPTSAVAFRFKINHVITGPQKVERPDETGPEFSYYDRTDGKCGDTGEFQYRTWLRVVDCERVKLMDIERFTNARNGKPIRQVRGHTPFYTYAPNDVTALHGGDTWPPRQRPESCSA